MKLNAMALGYAAATASAIGMLILGIAGNLNIYTGAVAMMRQWHMFFGLNFTGILFGMIEAAIISFVFAYLLGWLYNSKVSNKE